MTKARGSLLFSAHSLQAYVDCERRFELSYLEELEWPAVESEPLLESERHMADGRRFHEMVHRDALGLAVSAPGDEGDEDIARWWRNYETHRPGKVSGDRFSDHPSQRIQHFNLGVREPLPQRILHSPFHHRLNRFGRFKIRRSKIDWIGQGYLSRIRSITPGHIPAGHTVLQCHANTMVSGVIRQIPGLDDRPVHPGVDRQTLGAVAAGVYSDIPTAMERMSRFARVHEPQGGAIRDLHDARFSIFEQFQSVARQAARS